MKKIALFLLMFAFFFLLACEEPVETLKIEYNNSQITIKVDEVKDLNLPSDVNVTVPSNDIIVLEDGSVTGLKEGTVVITLVLKADETVTKEVTIKVETKPIEKYTISYDLDGGTCDDLVTEFTDYKEVVTGFVNEVEKFILESEKSYYSNFEKSGFSAFITEWHMLKKSLNIDYNIDIIKDKLTDDFININEQDIIGINKYGITFNNFVFFEFEQDIIDPIGDILIVKNYCLVIYGKIYNKDIELNIVFDKDKFFTKVFRRNKTCKRFNELTSKIESYGYKLNKIV